MLKLPSFSIGLPTRHEGFSSGHGGAVSPGRFGVLSPARVHSGTFRRKSRREFQREDLFSDITGFIYISYTYKRAGGAWKADFSLGVTASTPKSVGTGGKR